MVNGANSLSGLGAAGRASLGSSGPAVSGGADRTGFADVLKKSIDEVSRLQQDASKAVEDVTTGKTDDVTGVMTAMEKADLAFKTLLAIRAKLMDAYEEIKQIQI